jgi:pimeloyl-ACP methyl ester carboxylesterase
VKSGGSHKESIRPALEEMIGQWSAWQPLHLEPRLLLGTSAMDKLKAKAPIDVPLLIILNPGDGQGNVKNADLLLPLFPQGKKIMLTDTGHMCNMETPELFNQKVLQFLESLNENK